MAVCFEVLDFVIGVLVSLLELVMGLLSIGLVTVVELGSLVVSCVEYHHSFS